MPEIDLKAIRERRERVLDKDNASKLAEASILIHADIPALLDLVDQLKAEKKMLQDEITEHHCLPKVVLERETESLRSQLAQAQTERDEWKRTAEALAGQQL